MKNTELTLAQAIKYYLKAFGLATKQINYLDNSNDEEVNMIMSKIADRIDADYKEVFLYPQLTKSAALYPTLDGVAGFIQDTMLYEENIDKIKEWLESSENNHS